MPAFVTPPHCSKRPVMHWAVIQLATAFARLSCKWGCMLMSNLPIIFNHRTQSLKHLTEKAFDLNEGYDATLGS